METYAHRLARLRDEAFVGRTAEQDRFLALLRNPEGRRVLHILAPGGTGKTTLLYRFLRLAGEEGLRAVRLDARHTDGTPASFLKSLSRALRLSPEQPAIDELNAVPTVLAVDTFELMGPLESWLLDEFLPRLSTDVRVVTAGRRLHSPRWRSDIAWQGISEELALGFFNTADVHAFLANQGIPQERWSRIAEVSYGSPLVLSLIAHLHHSGASRAGEPQAASSEGELSFENGLPQVLVEQLVDQLLEHPPTDTHRQALRILSLSRVLHEDLLAAMLPVDDARPYYEWLAGLSFVETTVRGLIPHDLVREVVVRDFKARSMDGYQATVTRGWAYYTERLLDPAAADRNELLAHALFLHRDAPMAQALFGDVSDEGYYIDRARDGDHPWVLDCIAAAEGAEARAVAAQWIARPETGTWVVRDRDGMPCGYLVDIGTAMYPQTPDIADEVTARLRAHIDADGGLRPAETMRVARYWGLTGGLQQPGPVQMTIFMLLSSWNLESGCAFVVSCFREHGKWLPTTGAFRVRLLAEVSARGQDFGWIGYNWRRQSRRAWLDAMASLHTGEEGAMPREDAVPALLLNRDDFDKQVRRALRALGNRIALSNNALARSRVVIEAAGKDAGFDAPRVLEEVLAHAITQLPEEMHGLLRATYFEGDRKHQAVALGLGLPYAIFRYRHTRALEQLCELLWRAEHGELVLLETSPS